MHPQAKRPASAGHLKVALGEYDTGWHQPEQSLARARTIARQAKDSGADAVVFPEMCASGFTMDVDTFAEPMDGTSVQALSRIAADFGLWVVGGLSIRQNGQYLNSALAFGPDGSLLATYNKQRLFGYARETAVYSPGTGPCVFQLGRLSVALFVCFDLRFPELFREVGPDVDVCVILANWPSARQRHWAILNQARAIENQCYVVAVNRTGDGDGLHYDGGSVILDPWGERCDQPVAGGALRIGQLSREVVDQTRKTFSVTDDRRVVVNDPTAANTL